MQNKLISTSKTRLKPLFSLLSSSVVVVANGKCLFEERLRGSTRDSEHTSHTEHSLHALGSPFYTWLWFSARDVPLPENIQHGDGNWRKEKG